jgi:uncharacterized membrane protein
MNPNRLAKVLALFLGFAGIMHFANPSFFNEIVPPWLPPSRIFWTYISGVAEVAIAIALIRPSTRRAGAIAAVWLFIAVYPANIYMVWDWRNEVASQQFISWARLPFQFLFVWVALQVARVNNNHPIAPGDIV